MIGGWLFFSYVGMQFLLGPTIGNLSDTYGSRPLLLLSVFGLAVDYLLTAFAPNMRWVFVGRIFAGLCGASYTTANASFYITAALCLLALAIFARPPSRR